MPADILIANFSTQREAAAAADKLCSIGLERAHLLLHTDVRGMQPPSSSSASSTIIDEALPGPSGPSWMDDQTRDETRRTRDSETLRAPTLQGHARLAIQLSSNITEMDATDVLRASGATRVERCAGPLPAPNPAMSPTVDVSSATDVDRAIEASRRGSARSAHDVRTDAGNIDETGSTSPSTEGPASPRS